MSNLFFDLYKLTNDINLTSSIILIKFGANVNALDFENKSGEIFFDLYV